MLKASIILKVKAFIQSEKLLTRAICLSAFRSVTKKTQLNSSESSLLIGISLWIYWVLNQWSLSVIKKIRLTWNFARIRTSSIVNLAKAVLTKVPVAVDKLITKMTATTLNTGKVPLDINQVLTNTKILQADNSSVLDRTRGTTMKMIVRKIMLALSWMMKHWIRKKRTLEILETKIEDTINLKTPLIFGMMTFQKRNLTSGELSKEILQSHLLPSKKIHLIRWILLKILKIKNIKILMPSAATWFLIKSRKLTKKTIKRGHLVLWKPQT